MVVFCFSTNQIGDSGPLGTESMWSSQMVVEVCVMAELFESSEEENNNEFVGFMIEEIPERPDLESDPEASGESDISLADKSSENGS